MTIMNLRHDIICEKVRSVNAIRKELAMHLRIMRRQRPNQSLWRNGIIAGLKWVLRHDIMPKAYYRTQYNREWPE